MSFFVNCHSVKPLDLSAVNIGGVRIEGHADIKVALDGETMQAVELTLVKGYYHPLHVHQDNESMGYIVSGRIEMVVGDTQAVLGPGDFWHHPRGVYHSTRALEDSRAVELHTPRRKEYKLRKD